MIDIPIHKRRNRLRDLIRERRTQFLQNCSHIIQRYIQRDSGRVAGASAAGKRGKIADKVAVGRGRVRRDNNGFAEIAVGRGEAFGSRVGGGEFSSDSKRCGEVLVDCAGEGRVGRLIMRNNLSSRIHRWIHCVIQHKMHENIH